MYPHQLNAGKGEVRNGSFSDLDARSLRRFAVPGGDFRGPVLHPKIPFLVDKIWGGRKTTFAAREPAFGTGKIAVFWRRRAIVADLNPSFDFRWGA